jgi:glycosyltransferase involved in cell wall biosynthesis
MKEFCNKSFDHITVCICTYKRAELLTNLLTKFENQQCENKFTYSIVIVDNDHNESAKETVLKFKKQSEQNIDYYCEPVQNIALARNKAVQMAHGDYIAFIDDDEYPKNNWLLQLYDAANLYKADGILGPVKSSFKTSPPKWIIKGQVFERESFKTGTQLKNPKYMRTGNLFLSLQSFPGLTNPFKSEYGRTGGEDVDFFRTQLLENKRFYWCDEAIVHEIIPNGRLRRSYLLKRALLRGVVNAKNTSIISHDMLKSFIAIIIYLISSPFIILIGHHIFMNNLIKTCDHLGKVCAVLGVKLVSERTI